MTALLAVEVRRILARRLVKVLVLVGLAAAVLIGVLVFVNTSSDPAAIADDTFDAREFVRDANGEAGIISGTAFVPLMLALILSASLAGAEWRAGTLPVLLTWEPRRTRVLLAKVAAAAATGAAVVIVLEVALMVAVWPSAVFHGTTAGTDLGFWADVAGDLLRVGAAGACVAVVAFSVAFLGRNTTAALAATVAYFILVENVIRVFRSGWARWFFTDNLFVFLLGSADDADVDFSASVPGSAAILGVYAGILLVAALAWFQARDVT